MAGKRIRPKTKTPIQGQMAIMPEYEEKPLTPNEEAMRLRNEELGEHNAMLSRSPYVIDAIKLRVACVSEHAKVPRVMQAGDVAADVYAAEAVTVPARGKALIATGLVFEIPAGFRIRLHTRSGMGLKGIEVGAGLIDTSYRHPVGVVLHNHTDAPYPVEIGDRIAQMCYERVTTPMFVEVDPDEISTSARSSGWGSSGV